jgi:hypothetical protein
MGIGGGLSFSLFWHLVDFFFKLAHSGFPFFCIITYLFSPLLIYIYRKVYITTLFFDFKCIMWCRIKSAQ